MKLDVVRQVWQRAESRCEYCHVPVSVYPLPFHVDHILGFAVHGAKTIAPSSKAGRNPELIQ